MWRRTIWPLIANSTVSATVVERRIFVSSGRRENRWRILFPRSRIRGVIRNGRIGMAVLVQVPGRKIARLGNRDERQHQPILLDEYGPLQEVQDFRQRPLMENVKIVLARRDVGDGELAAPRGGGVPGTGQNRDDGAHRGVNIAKNAHDSGYFERLGAIRAGRVQSRIERLSAEVGKGVVIDGIE